MTYLSLLALWVFVPTVFYLLAVLRVRRLRRHREHDLILYAFCAARDTIATKVLRDEIDDRSQIFQYFYKVLSAVIHEHKKHPIGFTHIARNLQENKNRPAPTWVLRLIREIRKGDEETKRMVLDYLGAIELVMKQDSVISIVERIPFLFRKHAGLLGSVANQKFMPSRQRRFARFNFGLAQAAGFSPLPGSLCAA